MSSSGDFFAASFTTHTYTLKFRLEPPWFLNQWCDFCLIIYQYSQWKYNANFPPEISSLGFIFTWVKKPCNLWNDWWLGHLSMRHLTSEIGQIIYQTKASSHDIKDDRNFNFVPILKRCMKGRVLHTVNYFNLVFRIVTSFPPGSHTCL